MATWRLCVRPLFLLATCLHASPRMTAGRANNLKRARAIKLVDGTSHPEPKLQRMAALVREQLQQQQREEAEAAARKAALGVTNGAPAAANGDADGNGSVKPEPEDDDAPPDDVKGADDVVSEEEIAKMTEELETMQKQKHLLFVRLKEVLKDDERSKAAAEAAAEAEKERRREEGCAARAPASALLLGTLAARHGGRS
eukprot:5445890-Prymnesium_polylepis.1